MAEYAFGVAEILGTDVLIENFTESSPADTAEARDNSGDVAAFKTYNLRKEISFTALYPTGTTAPAVGSTVLIDGVAYLIDSVTKSEVNTDYTKWSITGKRFTKNGIPSSSSSSSSASV